MTGAVSELVLCPSSTGQSAVLRSVLLFLGSFTAAATYRVLAQMNAYFVTDLKGLWASEMQGNLFNLIVHRETC